MKRNRVRLLTTAVLLLSIVFAAMGVWAAQEKAVPVLTPRVPTVSFEGAVELNIYYTLTNGADLNPEDMGMITFTTKPDNGTVENADQVIHGAVYDASSGMYIVHSAGIPAKNLGDDLYCRIYARMADGSYVYSNTFSYSVLKYAHGVLSNPGTGEKMRQLMISVLDYGASAQQYFNYQTDTLVNRGVATDGHIYNDLWTLTTAPGLGVPGVESCVCTICGGAALTREVPALTLTALNITKQPLKQSYYNAERFDPTGMEVTALLSDGSSQIISDYTVDKTLLSPEDTCVTVTYGDACAHVDITVSPYERICVSALAQVTQDTAFVVEGYVAGVAEEGPSADQELILKDTATDDVIALRGVPYGSFPDYGYRSGDLVNLIVTMKVDGTVNTPNKRYLAFSEENGEQEETILSSGHDLTYDLENVTTISSWEQMQTLFQAGSVPDYSYIRLEGPIFFNRYSGSDGVTVSRIHMNQEATGVSGIRTDGSRTVSLRDNVMEANLGADWQQLFFETQPTTGQYPGMRINGSVTALYTGGNNFYYQLTVLDDSWVELNSCSAEDALVYTAQSYYEQGTQIQYDQTQSRRNLNPPPEMATAENTVFLDCSSYVNSVYRSAYGVDVMDSTKISSTANFIKYCQEGAGDDVLGYWVNADYTTDAQITTLLGQVRGMLQLGDLLIYRHGETSGSSGHVYVYMGEDRFLHCTGSSYVYNDIPSHSYDKGTTAEKTGGAVQWIDADDIFTNTTHTRYLFKSTASDTVYSIGLLRPLNRGLTPTAQAKERARLGGLIGELSVSSGQYHSVFAGDTLTYTLTLHNPSVFRACDVNVQLSLSDTLTPVTLPDGMTYENGLLTWSGKVNGTSDLTLSFTAQVNAGAGEATVTGSIGAICLNTLRSPISGLTAQQLSKVTQAAAKWTGSFSDPLEPVRKLYQDTLGVTICDHTTAAAVLADLIDTDNATCRTDTALSQMLVPNLYGGLSIKSGYLSDNNRSRLPVESHFTEGDIILARYDDVTEVFVYLGGGKLARFSDGSCTVLTSTGDAFSGTNVFTTLIAYDVYGVIRPGVAVDNGL